MTRNTVLRRAVVSVALTLASGCGGAASPAAPPPAAGKASGTAGASASAVVTPKPRKADDQRLATAALVTAKDLGKPWVKPKKVNTIGKRGQLCPGRPSVDGALRPLARAGTSLVRGTKTGAAIGSFTIRTYSEPPADFRREWDAALAACGTYRDASKLHVKVTNEGPESVPGVDEHFARVERIYYDARHKRLAYARHVLAARQGRVVSEVEYAFLIPESDPRATDFTPAVRLLRAQLTKVESAFGR